MNFERNFRREYCFMRSRLVAFIARIIRRSVPKIKGFGKFGGKNSEMNALASFGAPSIKDKYMIEHKSKDLGQGRQGNPYRDGGLIFRKVT